MCVLTGFVLGEERLRCLICKQYFRVSSCRPFVDTKDCTSDPSAATLLYPHRIIFSSFDFIVLWGLLDPKYNLLPHSDSLAKNMHEVMHLR